MSMFKQAVTIFFSAGKAEKEGELRGMNEPVLRSRVHGCAGFFKREGEKNLQGMKGKGLRSHIHFAFAGNGNAFSFLLISPVLLPDNFFHLAIPPPVMLNRHNQIIHLLNGYITETQTSTALQPCGFHLVRAGDAEPDG
jgi:hypothetical protein